MCSKLGFLMSNYGHPYQYQMHRTLVITTFSTTPLFLSNPVANGFTLRLHRKLSNLRAQIDFMENFWACKLSLHPFPCQ